MSTDFAWTCQICGSTAPPSKVSDITRTPEVLMLQLKRWAGREELGALLHRVEANQMLTFGDREYSLCSFVSHIGPIPKAGHYTCCVKNPSARGEWWYYNNSMRRLARDSDLDTSAAERTYLLLYERLP